MEVGEKNLQCMALLDKANTESYGTPAPATVPLTVEKGPFIVITGHDLHDLKLLLEQTEGKGVNIYTHGEMLPAHGYPELKKYAHLKGNFGTAWQNQQREFADIPAPVLFTTNCLIPPKASYADRVFTTAVVSYPEMTHIGEDKDFTPVIEKEMCIRDRLVGLLLQVNQPNDLVLVQRQQDRLDILAPVGAEFIDSWYVTNPTAPWRSWHGRLPPFVFGIYRL